MSGVLNDALVQIDKFMSSQQMSEVKFLACSIVPQGEVDASPDVTSLLEKMTLSCGGEPPVAIAILCRILRVIGFGDGSQKRNQILNKLDQFAAQDCALQTVAPNLPFYEFLYVVASKIGNGRILKKLCKNLDEEKVGTHHHNIKTSLQLLQFMVIHETIKPNNVDELIKLLRDSEEDSIAEFVTSCQNNTENNPESDVVCIVQTLSVTLTSSTCIVGKNKGFGDATKVHKMAAKYDTLPDSEYYLGLNYHILQHPVRPAKQRPFFSLRKRTYAKMVCAIVFLVSILAISVCSTLMLAFFKHNDLLDDTNVYGNITFQGFHRSFDVWYYDKIRITIKPLDQDYNSKHDDLAGARVQLCQRECSNGELVRSLTHNDIIHNEKYMSDGFYAKFHNGSNARNLSVYMLKGSTMTFKILHYENAINVQPNTFDVTLIVFTDVEQCDDFFGKETISFAHQTIAHSFRNWTSNNNTHTIHVSEDSYYCAVWKVPGNTSFTYSATAKVHYYPKHDNCTLSRQLEQNSKVITKTYPVANRDKVETHLIGHKKACIFISQQEENTPPIRIELVLYSTPFNIGFVVSLLIICLSFVSLCMVLSVCFVMHACTWCKY